MRFSKLVFHSYFFWIGLIVLYLALHVPNLTLLPVFADEAIYIRWAQLILSDWSQYLLFPLNDGKTPLFIWMIVPFIKYIEDPLLAGRVVAVSGGLVQMILMVLLLQEIKVRKFSQAVGALIVCVLPFWFFHHRMVLMDGWLTVWISLATLALLKVTGAKSHGRKLFIWLIVGALSVWAGLLTKVPFVLAIPGLFFLLFRTKLSHHDITSGLKKTTLIVGSGMIPFLFLTLAPVFPQLFSRGGDFLLPLSEVVAGRWRETLPSIPTYLGYFATYCGWGILLLAVTALLQPGKRRMAWIFAGSFLLFSAPIWLLGKVVYPRYLFPSVLYVTLVASIGADTLLQWSVQKIHTKSRRLAIRILLVLLLFQFLLTSFRFIIPSWIAPNELPFVSADRTQYLTSWSSGHGLKEIYRLLQEIGANQTTGSVVVATEGSFGSLPDGLLLYNFRRPLQHVWIEGLGYPVTALTESFYSRISSGDRVLLVINSDRLNWQLSPSQLLEQYCRPYEAPCLQVWDITQTYSEYKKH